MIKEIVINYLVPTFITLLSAVLAYVSTRIKNIYEEKMNSDTKKKIIDTTVLYIEQIYKDLSGHEKLEKCKEKALEWLSEEGLNVSKTELEIIIESSVNKINKTKK